MSDVVEVLTCTHPVCSPESCKLQKYHKKYHKIYYEKHREQLKCNRAKKLLCDLCSPKKLISKGNWYYHQATHHEGATSTGLPQDKPRTQKLKKIIHTLETTISQLKHYLPLPELVPVSDGSLSFD